MRNFLGFLAGLVLGISAVSAGDLVVMRHGQADHNVLNIYNANPDHANYRVCNLTAKGKETARKSAVNLKAAGYTKDNVALALVSPLPRTCQTIQILVDNGVVDPSVVRVEPRVIEAQIGDLEGCSQIGNGYHEEGTVAYGGESYEDLRNRMVAVLEELGNTPVEGHVLIVTHGSPALEVQRALTGSNEHFQTAEYRVFKLPESSVVAGG